MRSEPWQCEKCGTPNARDALACARCGQPRRLPGVGERATGTSRPSRVSKAAAVIIILGAIAAPLAVFAVYVTVRPPPGPGSPTPINAPTPPPATKPEPPSAEDAYVAGANPIWCHALAALAELAGVVEVGNVAEVARTAEQLRIEFDGMRVKARDLHVPSALANVHYELLTALERSAKLCDKVHTLAADRPSGSTLLAQEELIREVARDAEAAYDAVPAALPDLAAEDRPNLVDLAGMVAQLMEQSPTVEDETSGSAEVQDDAGHSEPDASALTGEGPP